MHPGQVFFLLPCNHFYGFFMCMYNAKSKISIPQWPFAPKTQIGKESGSIFFYVVGLVQLGGCFPVFNEGSSSGANNGNSS
jgi:hypothetical protein